MVDKKCSKCGSGFDCCADGSGCWCEQYSVSTTNLELLRKEYQDCLCSKCLSSYQDLSETTLDKE